MNKKKEEQLKALRTGQYVPESSGEHWPKDALRQLKEQYYEGMGISEMALMFGRSEIAIYQQLAKNGLLEDQCQTRKRRSCPRRSDCLCSLCAVSDCPNRREAYVGV